MARRRDHAARTHLETAREAGLGRLSGVSVLAGLITAYGAFAVVAAIVGSILSAADVQTDFRTDDWTSSGGGAALATGAALLVAYLFGGYVAGRMARRSGLLHGVAVAVASLVIGGVVGGIVAGLTDDAQIRSNLRSIGAPTAWDQVRGVAVAGAIVSVAAIFVGAVIGGMLGERWHAKLARRASDPAIGPAAVERRRAEAAVQAARAREEADRAAPADDAILAREQGRSRVRRADTDPAVTGETVDLRDPLVGQPYARTVGPGDPDPVRHDDAGPTF